MLPFRHGDQAGIQGFHMMRRNEHPQALIATHQTPCQACFHKRGNYPGDMVAKNGGKIILKIFNLVGIGVKLVISLESSETARILQKPNQYNKMLFFSSKMTEKLGGIQQIQ